MGDYIIGGSVLVLLLIACAVHYVPRVIAWALHQIYPIRWPVDRSGGATDRQGGGAPGNAQRRPTPSLKTGSTA